MSLFPLEDLRIMRLKEKRGGSEEADMNLLVIDDRTGEPVQFFHF